MKHETKDFMMKIYKPLETIKCVDANLFFFFKNN